ncbi:MAG: YdcF family protein [Armatimonadetes bacterium]|nr:YdcF family protein [Armatimonadota bacterium]
METARRRRWPRRLLIGCCCAGMAGAAFQTAVSYLSGVYPLPLTGGYVASLVVGLVAGCAGRWRWLVAATGAAGVVFAVAAVSPLPAAMLRGVSRSDAPRHADAIVVLAAGGQDKLKMTDAALPRLLRGVELRRAGWAPNLLISRGRGDGASWIPEARRQLEDLRLDVPMLETRTCENTHDEALETARIARERGWKHVIVVSQAWHLKRSGGVFEGAGLRVTCVPCRELRYDERAPSMPASRVAALRDSLHEIIGLAIYKRRGWIRP